MVQQPRSRSNAKPPRHRSLEDRVYAVYAGLPPAEKRLADVLRQFQMDLPSYTAGELADQASVSRATAARLIRTLGYATFPEAKRLLRNDQHWGSPRGGLAEPNEAPSEVATIGRMVEADLDNIRVTAESIPSRTLAEISQVLATAPRLWIMGLRSGYGLAHHAAHYFRLMRRDVQVLSDAGANPSHQIAALAPDDALLVIAFRRRPRLLRLLLAEARSVGATTILVTDLSASATARAATHVLRCRCRSPSPFNSFAAAVTLINYLAWSVTTLLGEASVARFQQIDRLVELLDDVSTPQTAARR